MATINSKNNVQSCRRKRGLSVFDLSRAVGVTPAAIYNIEKSRDLNVSLYTAAMIAAVLMYDIETVFPVITEAKGEAQKWLRKIKRIESGAKPTS